MNKNSSDSRRIFDNIGDREWSLMVISNELIELICIDLGSTLLINSAVLNMNYCLKHYLSSDFEDILKGHKFATLIMASIYLSAKSAQPMDNELDLMQIVEKSLDVFARRRFDAVDENSFSSFLEEVIKFDSEINSFIPSDFKLSPHLIPNLTRIMVQKIYDNSSLEIEFNVFYTNTCQTVSDILFLTNFPYFLCENPSELVLGAIVISACNLDIMHEIGSIIKDTALNTDKIIEIIQFMRQMYSLWPRILKSHKDNTQSILNIIWREPVS